MKSYWIVWHSHKEKGEGVVFDNEADAVQTAHGDFQQFAPAIGEAFFEQYSDNSPLQIQKIELPF